MEQLFFQLTFNLLKQKNFDLLNQRVKLLFFRIFKEKKGSFRQIHPIHHVAL